MKKANNILTHTECLSEEMLTKYVSEKLSPAQKHEVERHLTDCDMCSDAVEGLALIADKNRIDQITSELNTKIANRVGHERKAKIIFLQQYRTQLAVAASLVVLLGLIWFFRSKMATKELTPESSEKIFADKFEPYPALPAEEEGNASESPISGSNAASEQKQSDQHSNEIPADKNVAAEKEASTAAELSQTVTMNDESGYQAVVTDKKTATPVTSVPQRDVVVADEVVQPDRAESTPKQAVPHKPALANTSSTGATAGVKNNSKITDDEYDRATKEAEKQQLVESVAIQTKSESGKNKAKKKRSAHEQPAPAQQQEVSGNIVVMESVAMKIDSVPSGTVSDDADLAMQKYEQKDYEGAAMDFEAILKSDPDNYNALFYSSVSYLSTGETDKAIVNLNKVLEKKDGSLYDAAQWYLSLAYIKKNDTQNARKNLLELQQNSRSRYQKQANETLKDMRK